MQGSNWNCHAVIICLVLTSILSICHLRHWLLLPIYGCIKVSGEFSWMNMSLHISLDFIFFIYIYIDRNVYDNHIQVFLYNIINEPRIHSLSGFTFWFSFQSNAILLELLEKHFFLNCLMLVLTQKRELLKCVPVKSKTESFS